MTSIPTIRTFDLDRDYDAVLAVWRAAEPAVHVGQSDSPDALRLKLSRDPGLFLVAEAAGRVVGAVLGGGWCITSPWTRPRAARASARR